MEQTLTRRTLLRTSAIVPAGIILARCAPGNNPVPQFVAALQAVGQEATLILPQLTTAGLSATAANESATIIQQIEAAAAAIGAASTATQGQTTLIQIEGYINALAPLALPFVSMVPGGAALGLIVAALPAIEFTVNILVSLLSPQAKQLAASAPPLAGRRFGAAEITPQDYLNKLLRETGH